MSLKALSLTPCDDAEYAEFVSQQLVEYARQLARAGEVSAEESIAAARERLRDLRADRLRGIGHDFLVARSAADACRVGWVWVSPAPEFLGPERARTRWLSQLTVDESRRGEGWGRALLTAIEDHERARGCHEIWLRVFRWNSAALQLYRSQGYELAADFETDVHLRKRITLHSQLT